MLILSSVSIYFLYMKLNHCVKLERLVVYLPFLFPSSLVVKAYTRMWKLGSSKLKQGNKPTIPKPIEEC